MRRRGITLLELLISTVMVAIITGAATRAFLAGFDFERNVETRRAAEEGHIRFEERLAGLIKHVFVSGTGTDADTYLIATSETGSTEDGADRLIFTARGERLPYAALLVREDFETANQLLGPQGGTAELSLSTTAIGEGASGEGLFLREQRPADGDPEQGGIETLLNAEVATMRFEFWDGAQWVPEWDSRQTQGRLPAVVRVRYQLREEPAERLIHVRIPLSDATAEDPVVVGEGG